MLVTEYLDGVPLDELLRADPPTLDWETLGYNLGWGLGCLSSIPFLRFGRFANAHLALTTDGMPTDLTSCADHLSDRSHCRMVRPRLEWTVGAHRPR